MRSWWWVLSLGATAAVALVLTSFHPPAETLASSSWGAGTPTSSGASAFATFRPWWREVKPDAVVVTEAGGIEPRVDVDRDDLKTTRHLRPPLRGVGYDMFLGAVVFWRSLFSPSLVFDWALVLRLQQALLVAALLSLPVALWFALPDRRTRYLLAVYPVFALLVTLAWPNRPKFVVEGIVDSAISSPLALFAVGAYAVVWRAAASRRKWALASLVAASLLLGYAPLVRGELAAALGLTHLFLLAVAVARSRASIAPRLVSVAIAALPTVAASAVNDAVFGHFTLRMQAAQNLFEPIGQYPNPYGIEYSDVWFESHVRALGYDYPSFEADDYARGRYGEILRERPGLLWSNFTSRLATMRGFFKLPLHAATLGLSLAVALWVSVRRPRLVPVFVPLVLAIGLAIFLAWTHDLPRAIVPIHYLANAFLAFLLSDLAAGWIAARAERTAAHPAQEPATGTPPAP
jgi:hypothetical protein